MIARQCHGGARVSMASQTLKRHPRLGWGTQLLLALLVLCVSTSVMAKDPLIDVWRAHRESFRSLEVEMSVKISKTHPSTEVSARIDLETDMWKGTIVKPIEAADGGQEFFIREWGRTNTLAWRSSKLPETERRYDIEPLPGSVLEGSVRRDLGFDVLQYAFESELLTYADAPQLQVDLMSREPSPVAPHAERLTYSIANVQNGREGFCRCDVDLSDGVRLYRTELEANGQVGEVIECSDFVRAGGVWFPKRIAHVRYRDSASTRAADTAPPVEAQEEAIIRVVTVNKDFTAADMLPNPRKGDRVVDQIAGVTYLYGDMDIAKRSAKAARDPTSRDAAALPPEGLRSSTTPPAGKGHSDAELGLIEQVPGPVTSQDPGAASVRPKVLLVVGILVGALVLVGVIARGRVAKGTATAGPRDGNA